MTADRITGDAEPGRARAAGFDAFVEKPFNETAFRALLEPFLGSRLRDDSTDPEAT
jgi:hypothetical protein